MYSPCFRCRKEYSEECIKDCDYARSVAILKEVLIINEGCQSICKKGYPEKGVGYTCNEYDDGTCVNHSLCEIDYERVMKDYAIKLD